jgi:Zn-finger nucleic acid-binding protein
MICPVCKIDMIDVEYNRIELDYCNTCRGVWFDADELELLIESMGLEESGMSVDKVADLNDTEKAEKRRKCPICRLKMDKAHIGQEPRILIDVCPRADGLWFDGGEVGQLIKQLVKKPSKKGGSQQKVINFLGEVFSAAE